MDAFVCLSCYGASPFVSNTPRREDNTRVIMFWGRGGTARNEFPGEELFLQMFDYHNIFIHFKRYSHVARYWWYAVDTTPETVEATPGNGYFFVPCATVHPPPI